MIFCIMLLIWLFFGFFNWMAMIGSCHIYQPTKNQYLVALSLAILGPLASLGILIGTDFLKYGLRLR